MQNSDEEKEVPTSPRNRTTGSYLSRSRRRQSSSSSLVLQPVLLFSHSLSGISFGVDRMRSFSKQAQFFGAQQMS